MKKIYTLLFLTVIVSGLLFTNFSVSAEIIPSSGKADGNYTLNDFMLLAINFSKFLLSITGALALLAFVVGGMMFLISAGSSEKVETAKKIIIGAVIGIFIVFTSYIIIGFVFKAMGIESNWFESTWMK